METLKLTHAETRSPVAALLRTAAGVALALLAALLLGGLIAGVDWSLPTDVVNAAGFTA